MKIRKATKRDIQEIARIFWIESSKPPYNKKRTLAKVIKIIENDFQTSDLYLAIDSNKVIGFIILQKDSGIKYKLWINELWILKEYQKKGIGGQIMNYIEEIYSKKGIKIFELVADTKMGGALEFYEKIGYVIDDGMVFMKKEK
jgi:GNAT superfamily N-acetyltransferase